MTVPNPFRQEIDHLNGDLLDAVDAIGAASPAERERLIARRDALAGQLRELETLEAEWVAGQLTPVVQRMREMAAMEAARQGRPAARLLALLNRARNVVNLAPLQALDLGGAPATLAATPIPIPAAPAAANAPALGPAPLPAASAAVDPEARDTDLGRLHPIFRAAVQKVIAELAAENVPMRVFEACRSPERQRHLFAKGRTRPGPIVTKADAWESAHQYGFAVDMVIDQPMMNPWETAKPEAQRWWKAYEAIAKRNGLRRLSFELPHIELDDIRYGDLRKGIYPPGGDAAWVEHLEGTVRRWHEPDSPPLAPQERPALSEMVRPAVRGRDWASLPRVPESDFRARFGGQAWCVRRDGVLVWDEERTRRTAGQPSTCSLVLDLLGEAIFEASVKHGVPPELLVMTIATEAELLKKVGFSGPRSFRWESRLKDYSAGPMQILAGTARSVNKDANLGYNADAFPEFSEEPAQPPSELPLYQAEVALDVGAAFIASQAGATAGDPILTAAAYNAGSLRQSRQNPWCLHCTGDHLDRASRWFGDACEALRLFGR